MSELNEEQSPVKVGVSGVLEKFDGEAKPENLTERLFIEEDEVVKIEYYENGVLKETAVRGEE